MQTDKLLKSGSFNPFVTKVGLEILTTVLMICQEFSNYKV